MQINRRTLLAAAVTSASVTSISGIPLTAHAQKRRFQDKEMTSSAGHKLNFGKFEQMEGFDTGNKASETKLFVFFDTQCPHCAALWNAHKPLQDKVHFRWIPVGVLNRSSVMQGSTILGAANPASKMDEHEQLMTQRRGGITVDGESADKFADKIKAQTESLRNVGARSVPFMAYVNAKGEAVSAVGAMPTPVLASFLGLVAATPGLNRVAPTSAAGATTAPAAAAAK